MEYDKNKKPIRMLGTHTDISFEKKMEEELKKTIESLDSIIQSIPSGLFVYQYLAPKQLILVDGNQEACRLSGISLEECRGKDVMELFPAVVENGVLEEYLGVVKNGGLFETEKVFYKDARINGAFRIRAFKLPNDKLGIAFENVTNRMQIEDELRLKTQAIDSSLNAIAIADSEGKLTYVNPAFVKMWGYDNASEAIGISSSEFWEERAKAEDIKQLIIEQGYYQGEMLAKKANGELFHTLLTSSTVFTDEGKARYLMASFIDINERRKLEEAQLFLIHSDNKASNEDFFRSVAKHLYESTGMDFVCIDRLDKQNLNAQTLAVYSNGQFQENYTYPIKHTPCGDLVGSEICCFKQNVKSLFPSVKLLQEMNAESYIGTTLWDSSGNAIGLIAMIGKRVLEDTSFIEAILNIVAIKTSSEIERRDIENDLRITVNQKELLMKEIQHRVKNNLNVISSLLSLELSRIEDANTRQTYISTINRIYSMSSLYEKLYLSDNLKHIDLNSYVKDLVKSIYQSYCIDPCRILLDMKLDEVFLESRRAIPLGLILNELISNALKYAYPGDSKGVLRVRMKKVEQRVDICVSDEGIGFNQKETAEITKSIGIMLVKMLAKQIKADYVINSDNGTCVKISFEL